MGRGEGHPCISCLWGAVLCGISGMFRCLLPPKRGLSRVVAPLNMAPGYGSISYSILELGRQTTSGSMKLWYCSQDGMLCSGVLRLLSGRWGVRKGFALAGCHILAG